MIELKNRCVINDPLFILELLKVYNMENCKEKSTQLEYGINSRPEIPMMIKKLQKPSVLDTELLGKIGYLACTVRPDLAIVVSKLSAHEQTR